jgi:hypothetical protein
VVAEASNPGLPEGEPFALREGWSGETRDQRLSSLATGVHLAPGDLTQSNRCILRAVATQTTAQQGASLHRTLKGLVEVTREEIKTGH